MGNLIVAAAVVVTGVVVTVRVYHLHILICVTQGTTARTKTPEFAEDSRRHAVLPVFTRLIILLEWLAVFALQATRVAVVCRVPLRVLPFVFLSPDTWVLLARIPLTHSPTNHCVFTGHVELDWCDSMHEMRSCEYPS